MRDPDRIIVLDPGRGVEIDDPESLLARGALSARLVSRQLAGVAVQGVGYLRTNELGRTGSVTGKDNPP